MPEPHDLSREDIEQVLCTELERAMARFRAARDHFQQLIADVPSEIPHPDGSLRLQQAGAEKRAAIAALSQALSRHNAFVLRGEIPQSLLAKPGREDTESTERADQKTRIRG